MERLIQIADFEDVKLNNQGGIIHVKPTVKNIRKLFRKSGVIIKFNNMARETEVTMPNKNKAYNLNNHFSTKMIDLEEMCNYHEISLNQKLTIRDVVGRIASDNSYHPVQELIESTQWDGKSRLNDLLETIKTPSREDTLKPILIRKWLISAVAAVYEKGGVSAEGTLVFTGKQGIGKTSWIKSLIPTSLKSSAFMESAILNPSDKDSVNQVVSKWIVELGELDATFRKSDIAALKGFLTRSVDEYRLPYARESIKYDRRTVFFGSVNDYQFLQDQTGNRRFWALHTLKLDYQHKIDVSQLWSEVKTWYDAGEKWHLTPQEKELLDANNASYTVDMPLKEIFNTTFYNEDGTLKQKVTAYNKQNGGLETFYLSNGIAITSILQCMGVNQTLSKNQKELKGYLSNQLNAQQKRNKMMRGWILPERLDKEETMH